MIPLDSSFAGGGAEENQVARMPEMEGDGVDEGGRKPYSITKSRESWTEPEHDNFLEALHLFDRDWRKIEAFVGSKTVIQKIGLIRNLGAPAAPQAVLPQQGSHIMEQGCVIPMNASTVATNLSANDAFPSWDNSLALNFSPTRTQGPGVTNNFSSSIESQSGTWPAFEAIEQEIVIPALRAMPDFAQVYNFLGSVFDPETSGHLQRLREMDPIDAETVLLLMKNLSMNLSSPNFEAHRRLLLSHGPDMDQFKHESIGDLVSTHSLHLPFMLTANEEKSNTVVSTQGVGVKAAEYCGVLSAEF